MNPLKTGLYTLLFLVMGACTTTVDGEDIKSIMGEAQAAVEAGDYATALKICNEITQSGDTAAMTWLDYCRSASIYAMAYDHDVDTETSMAMATKCIEKARKLQPDSVKLYIDSQSHEFSGALNTVIQTLDGLNTDRTNIADHEDMDFIENEETADHE